MRMLSKFVAAAAAAGLAFSLGPVGAAGAAPVVPDALFGQHISTITSGVPATLPSVGSIRLWDAGVSWADLEPSEGAYNWAPLDRALANAAALGASEILYTMGNTPRWAASNTNDSRALYGPGTNSHPRSNALYTRFLTALLASHPQITAVQVWNEANLPDFYNGTPAQMAQLTKDASVAVKSVNPRIKVVAASTTVRSKGPTTKFGKGYGAAMKKAGAWRYVDVVSGHFYPPSTKGPAERVKYIKKMKSYYKKYGARGKPMWDTEMAFGDTRRGFHTKYRLYTGATAATYVARAYLDSMRYGVQRVFWYLWDANVLGTPMTQGGQIQSGGVAFLQVRSWMSGKTWLGCKARASVTTCTLRAADGSRQYIRYAAKKKTIKVPAAGTVRYLDGSSAAVSRGQKLVLTSQPVLFG